MIRKITVLLHFPGYTNPDDVSHLYLDGSGGISERLFNDDKRSVQDTFSFALIHNQTVVDRLRSAQGKILCKILNAQTSMALFSGVIEPNISQGSHQVNEPIRLEATDATWRLDEMIAASFQFPSSLSGAPLKVCDYSDTGNSVFHQVCYMAGYAAGDLVSGASNTATVQHCSAKASQETYRQFLDGILFEHLLVLDDDGQGRLTTREWTRSSPGYDQTLDSKDLSIVEPVTWQRRYIQENGIALEWAGTQIMDDALLYRESLPVTAQGEFTGQPIAAGDYYPPDSDIQDMYQEYIERWLDIPYLERQTRIKNRDISLITTDQADPVFEADAGVVLDQETYDWHRSQIRFRNTAAETKKIYKLEVRGRALVRSAVYTTTAPEAASNPKPYTSRFVFSHATAQALANALALDIEYADFDYSFGLNYYIQPGTVVRLVNSKNNIDTRVIIRSCDYDIGLPVYRYTAVGLAEYSSLSFAEFVVSPSPGPLQTPGAPGYRTATMTLFKWLSSAPSGNWPTGFSTYTWATGEWTMPATPNSWTKTPGAPASGQLLYAINLIVTNNNTDAESTVYWLASPTVNVVGAAGTDGTPGDDGKTAEHRYAKNTSATTGPAFTANADDPGAAWTATEPAIGTTEYLWRISSMWLGTERQTDWSGRVRMSGIQGIPGDAGDPGTPAKYVVVNGEQAFKYAAGASTPTPTSITLTASLFGGLTTYDWEYWKTAAPAGWTDLSGTQNAQTYSLAHDNAAWGSAAQLRVRCLSGLADFDEITIVKLYDGTNGTPGAPGADAYSVSLSNEAHIIACDRLGQVIAGELGSGSPASCTVRVFRGATELTYGTGANQWTMALTSAIGIYQVQSGAAFYLVGAWPDAGAVDITITVVGGPVITRQFRYSKQAISKKNIVNTSRLLADTTLPTRLVEGTGATGGWLTTGGGTQCVPKAGPHGLLVPVIQLSSTDPIATTNGGINSQRETIADRTKRYRLAVFVQVLDTSGRWRVGGPPVSTHYETLAGVASSAPYFYSVVANNVLTPGRWYLLVGNIYEEGYSGGIDPLSGLYDVQTKAKVRSVDAEFRLAPTATTIGMYSTLYSGGSPALTTTQKLWLYSPRVDIVDGTGPTIDELLSGRVLGPSVSLATTSHVMRYDKDGVNTTGDITLTATPLNNVGAVAFSTSPSVTLTGAVNTWTLTPANFGSNAQVVVTVTVDGVSDSITIVRVQDGPTGTPGTNGTNGTNGLTAYMTNEAHVITTDFEGNNGIYTGSGTDIHLFEGTTAIQYDGTGTANGTFNVTATGSNITEGSKSDQGAFVRFGVASAMVADVASISFAITGKRADGTAISITLVQSFSKSKQGATGLGQWTPVLTPSKMIQVSGTAFSKSSGTGWDAQVYSAEGYQSCSLKFRAHQANAAIRFGISQSPSPLTDITVDYGFDLRTTGLVSIRESNSADLITAVAYTTATLFRINYDKSVVRYYINDVLVRTSAVNAGKTFYLDSSFSTVNGRINDISFGQMFVGTEILAGTITANEIAAGTITANKINTTDLFAQSLQLNVDGKIWAGNASFSLAELFLGRDDGAWKFRLGSKLTYDGVTLSAPGIFTEKIKVPSGGSIRYETGIGVQKRAVQLADEKIDWIDTPDTSPASPEILRARIGRLGVGDSVLLDGEFSAPCSIPWSGEVSISSTFFAYPSYVELMSGELRLLYRRLGDGFLVQRVWNESTLAWGNESVIEASISSHPIMVEMPSGQLRFAYRRGSDSALVERVWGGSTWGDAKVITTSGVNYPTYTLLKSGELRITYAIQSSGNVVQQIDPGTGWGGQVVILNDLSGGIAGCVQDEAGELRVMYSRAGQLYEKVWNGTVWSGEVSTGIGAGNYMVYTKNLNGKLTVALYTGSTSIREYSRVNGVWVLDTTLTISSSVYLGYIQRVSGEKRMCYAYDSTTTLRERTLQRYAQLGAGIIETGSNTDGSYIKFSDGTMQCWMYDGVVRAFGYIHTFPVPFSSRPIVSPTNDRGMSNTFDWLQPYDVTVSNFKQNSRSSAGTTQSVAINYIAFGRWK